MPLTEIQMRAAKGISPIHPLLGATDRKRTDVHAVDAKRVGANAGIKQRHGDGIRLFTGRTWQAEDAQRPSPGEFCQALAGKTRQRCERLRIAKEPRLGNDHRFDQRLLLIA
ncbi:hypothetical protein D9M71_835530 [compost metagenome]